MVRWRIYYSGGTTFDSSQGSPDDAPAWGVQVILQLSDKDRRRESIANADYYVYQSGFWVGSDLPGIIDRLANKVSFSGFLVGRWDPRDEFLALIRKSEKDTDFPQAQD